ncbi:MAG: type II toxin-antitoxin system RelE/ParE family toxin [Candidatus Diapherotrites archaeon]|nr:type II toxin-antitoxin system RelE/ParE family toxin [Candidatus Diapherotrites archaeon]
MSNRVVEWTEKFERQLSKLDNSAKEKIIKKIEKIKENPELGKPLKNVLKNCFEERIEKYRIIYRYDSSKLQLFHIHDKKKGSQDKSLINSVKNLDFSFVNIFFIIFNITKKYCKMLIVRCYSV